MRDPSSAQRQEEGAEGLRGSPEGASLFKCQLEWVEGLGREDHLGLGRRSNGGGETIMLVK